MSAGAWIFIGAVTALVAMIPGLLVLRSDLRAEVRAAENRAERWRSLAIEYEQYIARVAAVQDGEPE